MKVLVVDDEFGIRLALTHFFRGKGFEVLEASTGAEGLAKARSALPDIVFLDQRLPDIDGETLIEHLVSPEIDAWVVMMTAYSEVEKAVKAMKRGADYYFPKPLDLEKVAVILERLEEKLNSENELSRFRILNNLSCDEGSIIGDSPQMIRVKRLISLLACNPSTPVLIMGESGSGKELVAKAIHTLSGVRGAMVEINCATLSEHLLESELFGHEKGAFTDAKSVKPGLFEIADGGTIFLDELAEMPLSIQAKLLKVLDSKTFRRVGGVTNIKTTARFIAATNREIPRMVSQGLFREDLYYRINVMPLIIPPLRERGKDIIVMADYFTRRIGERMGKERFRISTETMGRLQNYRWPGNVRELKNVIERALILTDSGEILPEHLPSEMRQSGLLKDLSQHFEELLPLRKVEEEYIAHVLHMAGNNHSRAATVLGISRSTLLAKLKKSSVLNPDM